MSLTKIDTINAVKTSLGITKKDSTRIVESVFAIIKDELNKGNDIKISGFGRWTVKDKKKRRGRNPQTGKAIIIDARKVITFKTSPVLRNAVNCID